MSDRRDPRLGVKRTLSGSTNCFGFAKVSGKAVGPPGRGPLGPPSCLHSPRALKGTWAKTLWVASDSTCTDRVA